MHTPPFNILTMNRSLIFLRRTMISGKNRAISWNEIPHYVCTLLYSLQFVVARQFRILKSKKRAVFLNFADISHMREKTLDIPDIRDIFEKKTFVQNVHKSKTMLSISGFITVNSIRVTQEFDIPKYLTTSVAPE